LFEAHYDISINQSINQSFICETNINRHDAIYQFHRIPRQKSLHW